MAIFDAFHSCMWFEATSRRNAFASIVSGLFFFVGWWLIIDASTESGGGLDGAHHICGILGSVSFFMVNAVSNSMISESYSGGRLSQRGARIWLFVGFVLGFAAIIAAVWIMIAEFSLPDTKAKWPGVALLLQNLFIFLGSLVYKFGRSESDSEFGF
ncbi:transmembrane protein 50B [Sergentomyia squamirostris]